MAMGRKAPMVKAVMAAKAKGMPMQKPAGQMGVGAAGPSGKMGIAMQAIAAKKAMAAKQGKK